MRFYGSKLINMFWVDHVGPEQQLAHLGWKAPGISKDDQDLIRPGRITMKPTIEQNALVKACKPGTPLLLEDGIMEVGTMENGRIWRWCILLDTLWVADFTFDVILSYCM